MLEERVEGLKSYLNIDQKRIEIADEEALTQDPTFWDDPKKAEVHLKKIRAKKVWTEAFDAVETALEDLKVLAEFFAEGEVEEVELDKQHAKCMEAIEELERKRRSHRQAQKQLAN